MKRKTNLIRFIQLWGIVLIVGIGGSVLLLDFLCSYHDFNLRSRQMRLKYNDDQKQMIRQEVKQVVSIINYKKANNESLTKKKIRSRVYEAYCIAKNIYRQNKADKTSAEIKHMIVDALRPIRFARNTGYYFINGFDGKAVLFPIKPSLEGVNLTDVKDTHGQYITKDMIKIIKTSAGGFYEYHWLKPGGKGADFKKIAFIKLFKPYNWFIGAGLYVDDVEDQIKTDLLKDISRIRFGREGYIFINRFNGDALVSNGKIIFKRKKLWEIFNKNPEKTKNIFRKEYQAALKPHGDYIYYSWVKLNNLEKESPKASFICGISDLKWIVGAGVYLDDVEKDITAMQAELNREMKTRFFYFFLLTSVIVCFFLFFLRIMTRRLKNDFNLFILFFDGAVSADEQVNRDLIHFAELDRMAEYANEMLEERKKSTQEILNEKERLAVTIHSIGDGVITCDRTGKIELINRVAEKLTGWKFKEAENRALPEVFNIINSDTGEKAVNPVDKVLTDGKITGLANHTVLISRDGNKYQIADSAAPIKDKNGNITGVVLVFRDVTNKYRIREEMQKIDKLKSVGTLAGGIAHDFNNIMTGMFGNISIAKTKLGKDHSEFKFLEKAEQSMHRAVGLTRQLLTFAKGGKPVLEKRAVGELIEEMIKFDLSGSNVKPFFNIPDNLWMVKIDRGQIQQVFSNLTINACQAMPHGGNLYITLKNIELVETETADLKQGRYIKITVQDEGCGMNNALLDRVFDPYFTTKETGSGLGLAVAYSIVKKHGGHINAASEPGNGTCFSVFLPACMEIKPKGNEKNADNLSSEQRSVESHTGQGRTLKILIMDDDEAVQMVVGAMLGTIGFSSESAADGDQALNMYRKSLDNGDPFDAIIMDLTIPGGMGGKEAVKKVLLMDPNARVIVSSGYADDPVMANYAEYGFKGIITKPYTMGNLKNVMEDVLKQ